MISNLKLLINQTKGDAKYDNKKNENTISENNLRLNTPSGDNRKFPFPYPIPEVRFGVVLGGSELSNRGKMKDISESKGE